MNYKDQEDSFADLVTDNSSCCKNISEATKKNLFAYKNNYIFAHIEVLENRFPATLLALNKSNFRFFAAKYIKTEPPQSENIDDYGLSINGQTSLASFLNTVLELEGNEIIVELAKIDLLRSEENTGKSVTTYQGTLSLWRSLLENLEPGEILNKKVKVTLVREGNDFFLRESKLT